jgi:hypothetical protein
MPGTTDRERGPSGLMLLLLGHRQTRARAGRGAVAVLDLLTTN